MTRRLLILLLNLLSALSLLLCVAVVVLWLRSYRQVDSLAYQSPRVELVDRQGIITFMAGHLLISWDTWEYAVSPGNNPPPRDTGFSYDGSGNFGPGEAAWHVELMGRWQMIGTYVRWRRWGFHFALSEYDDSNPGQAGVYRTAKIHIPLWFLTLLFAAAPSYWIVRWYRSCRRNSRGLCMACGYDLRATPDRCPECGHAKAAGESR